MLNSLERLPGRLTNRQTPWTQTWSPQATQFATSNAADEDAHMPIDLSGGGRIADPVHGYVDFTGIERVILDHPVSQRLRHVMQNGLACLVFPEAVTSRLSHSLGAMHLASRFLAA